MVISNPKIFPKGSLFPLVFPASIFLFFLLFAYELSHQSFLQSYLHIKLYTQQEERKQEQEAVSDPCTGRYIYVYDLPARFNSEIVQDCRNLSSWSDTCKSVANSGLGPKLSDNSSVLPENGWYATHQFLLEPIFHSRMKQYECLTTDYYQSTAVYIPFYVGLDIMRYLWGHSTLTRDALTNELVHWLRARPE